MIFGEKRNQKKPPVAIGKSCGIGKKTSVKDFLETPWLGLRLDLKIYPGPREPDGHRSWILEDPVRGNNYRLGFAEGEYVYYLVRYGDPDAALVKLYGNTGLRPTLQEAAGFIYRLQKESLAILPENKVIDDETKKNGGVKPSFFRKILQGSIFFRVPILRPDAFLNRTYPWVSVLWSPILRWIYLVCGIVGIILTIQQIELYLGTASYLLTPGGLLAFVLCLVVLKIGHEFAHAYATKANGLYVRSMGVFFIVLWPLLYTDTTEAWKIPNRRSRMAISGAGIFFELVVGGLAFLGWALLSDGVLRSLMFFLSGTSLVSSILINLNPFMRFDGYYVLMDLWKIDNLRPRAFALLKHRVRKILLDWKGPSPERHPEARKMMVYGFFAFLYRLLIAFSISTGIYYVAANHLFIPELGIMAFVFAFWLFLIRPLWMEIKFVSLYRRYLGSKRRLMISGAAFAVLILALAAPFPRMDKVPCLLVYREAIPVTASSSGQLKTGLPENGAEVVDGQLLAALNNDDLIFEKNKNDFDLKTVEASIKSYGSGGEEGAYRNWLLAEKARLESAGEKLDEAVSMLEIRAPGNGKIVDVNPDLYKGAFVSEGTYLFTIADPRDRELKAFIHEKHMKQIAEEENGYKTKVRFSALEAKSAEAKLVRKSRFPVVEFPNASLYDFAGGSIATIEKNNGRYARDAYYGFTFEMKQFPEWLPHGTPSWLWMKVDNRSLLGELYQSIAQKLSKRRMKQS